MRMFEPKRDEVIEDRRELHNGEHPLSSIIIVIKSRGPNDQDM
jgi:hypothetical protein